MRADIDWAIAMFFYMSRSVNFMGNIGYQASVETGFAPGRWDHWLLLGCFGAIATLGLWLSWQ
ncbi:MAG: hypothetical protein WBA76_11920 [Phormidesmis sp.]